LIKYVANKKVISAIQNIELNFILQNVDIFCLANKFKSIITENYETLHIYFEK